MLRLCLQCGSSDIRVLPILPLHFEVHQGAERYGAQIVAENFLNALNLSSMLSVEDEKPGHCGGPGDPLKKTTC